ncbi:hypothetical protein E1A91_D11G118900v1 [Gossypium mustelinum]|uniref:Uncharacterized protein n=1 Tax=Gossypium mustelinum TaxID=34275 RepID=A0A5D2SQJ0_GOSMU|nr:hypothetical protein E1A91_D11G118900v1 [Gossypium mustelinum]
MTKMKAPNSTNIKCMSIGEPNSIFNAPDFRSLSFSRLACLPEKPQKFPHLVSCNSKKEGWNSVKYEETNSITGPWTQTYFLS